MSEKSKPSPQSKPEIKVQRPTGIIKGQVPKNLNPPPPPKK